jgi:alkylhydroperoxidase family enzyme
MGSESPREGTNAVADLSNHLSPDEVYDAIVVVAHMNTANRVVLASGITPEDDLY